MTSNSIIYTERKKAFGQAIPYFWSFDLLSDSFFLSTGFIAKLGYSKEKHPQSFDELQNIMRGDHFEQFRNLVQNWITDPKESTFYCTTYFKQSGVNKQIQVLFKGEIIKRIENGHPAALGGSIKFLSDLDPDSSLNTFQTVYYQTDAEGIIQDISPEVRHLSGYTRDELIGQPSSMFYRDPEIRAALLQKLKKNGRVSDFKIQLVSASGKNFHVSVNSALRVDENGEVTGIEGVITNITEKVEAESELKDTRYFFNQIVSNTSDGIFVCDTNLIYTYWNPAMEKITGLKSEEVLGKSFKSLFPHTKKQNIDSMIHTALKGKPTKTDDFYYEVPKTGKSGWAQSSYVPRKNNDGEIIGLIGTVQEITDRKKTEEKLRESDKTLSQISAQIPGGIYQLKVYSGWNAEFLYVNTGFAGLVGLTEAEILEDANAVFDVIHRDDWENFRLNIRESFLELKDLNMEFRVVLQDESVRWLHSNSRPEKQQDGSVLWHGYLEDITAQKEAETAARQFQKQFEAIFNNVPNIIFIKDAEDRFLMVNKAAANFYNKSRDELIGNKDDYSGLSEDNKRRIIEADKKVMENSETVFLPENESITKDGRVFWHQSQKVPFTRPGTSEKTVLTIITDVTLRKQKEKELLETLSIVSEQNKRLLNFAHIVTHNLRNHVGNISMLLSLYQIEESEDEKNELIDLLSSASEGLKESIEDLIEIVEIRSQKEKKLELINLLQYALKIKEILKTEIDRNDVDFRIEIPESLNLRYIPAYLESILLNLASNAIKYSNPDKKSFVKISAASENGDVLLRVEDNGLGMDLDRYGDKLFGLYNTFHDNENSKGIGLFITKEQVESLGGEIQVESKVNHGTLFKIRLSSL